MKDEIRLFFDPNNQIIYMGIGYKRIRILSMPLLVCSLDVYGVCATILQNR